MLEIKQEIEKTLFDEIGIGLPKEEIYQVFGYTFFDDSYKMGNYFDENLAKKVLNSFTTEIDMLRHLYKQRFNRSFVEDMSEGINYKDTKDFRNKFPLLEFEDIYIRKLKVY